MARALTPASALGMKSAGKSPATWSASVGTLPAMTPSQRLVASAGTLPRSATGAPSALLASKTKAWTTGADWTGVASGAGAAATSVCVDASGSTAGGAAVSGAASVAGSGSTAG